MKPQLGLWLAAAVIAAAALRPAGAASECFVDVPLSGAVVPAGYFYYQEPNGYQFRNTPLGYGSINKGTVSGSVRVIFGQVAGGCAFGPPFALTTANTAQVNAALAAARLEAPVPLAFGNTLAVFSRFGFNLKQWSVEGLTLELTAPGPIGGKINAAKAVHMAVASDAGNATVDFSVSPAYYPGGWAAAFSFSLAGKPATVTTGCTLKLAKVGLVFTLDCSKLKITYGPIELFFHQGGRSVGEEGAAVASGGVRPMGDYAKAFITLAGSSLKGSAPLSAAQVLP